MDAGKVQRYLYGDCMKLARALYELTGWPIVGCHGAGEGQHYAVLTPDGRMMDAAGLRPAGAMRWPCNLELVNDCDCGCAPDDKTRADAGELLAEAGLIDRRRGYPGCPARPCCIWLASCSATASRSASGSSR